MIRKFTIPFVGAIAVFGYAQPTFGDSNHTLNVNVPTSTVSSDSSATTASTVYYIRERIIDNGDDAG